MKNRKLVGIVLIVLVLVITLWQLLPALNKSSNIRIGIDRNNLSNANRNLLS